MTSQGVTAETSPTWLVRAGRSGEDEESALTQGIAIVGFHDIGDLSGIKSLQDLISVVGQTNPGDPERRNVNRARQLWAFRDTIHDGDVVVLPLKTRPGQIALGRIAGPYRFIEVKGDKRHTRQVTWTHPDIPRSTFQQDLLYSFGAFLTVCRIARNDAERRIAAVALGQSDPGYGADGRVPASTIAPADTGPLALQSLDLAQAAHDEITAFVRERFRGHDMARLVEAVLRADGFVTLRSPLGRTVAPTSLLGGDCWVSTPQPCARR
jgi:restriction system protein